MRLRDLAPLRDDSRAARGIIVALTTALFLGCPDGLVRIKIAPKYVHTPAIWLKDNPSLEDGDPVAGRKAFIAAHCTDCHRVAEDPELPRGPRAIAEPPLADLDRYTRRALYDRIINRETGKGVELYKREMGEYVERLSARQLVDIVAYLRDPHQPAD